jgi:serine/threonine protein kinase
MAWARGGGGPDGRASDAAVAEAPARAKSRYACWDLEEGAPVVEGRYALASLGGGSRYEVYLAWDERLFALVVAKLLRPDLAADERALGELRREAAILRRLGHPALVRGFGEVLDGPRPHLVLKHVEGPSLLRLIRRHGALAPEQLLPLALHLVSVLHYLSREGVVHLDVKPANVVMGVPPRLIDLSIARPIESAARLRDAIGTDAYMAPEQCDPAAWPGLIGAAADVWALGATLHHAAAGEVPFPRGPGARDSADPAVRFPQLASAPAPLRSPVAGAFAEIVLRMLARDSRDRPTVAQVAAELEPLVAAVPARPGFSPRRGRFAV